MATEYVRVTIKTNKRPHSFWAYVEARGKNFNLYVPVDKEGRDFSREEKGTFILRKDLVQKTVIIKESPAKMNLKYGELEIERKPKPIKQQVSMHITPKSPRITPKRPRLRR